VENTLDKLGDILSSVLWVSLTPNHMKKKLEDIDEFILNGWAIKQFSRGQMSLLPVSSSEHIPQT
jgi:hypothetical protein